MSSFRFPFFVLLGTWDDVLAGTGRSSVHQAGNRTAAARPIRPSAAPSSVQRLPIQLQPPTTTPRTRHFDISHPHLAAPDRASTLLSGFPWPIRFSKLELTTTTLLGALLGGEGFCSSWSGIIGQLSARTDILGRAELVVNNRVRCWFPAQMTSKKRPCPRDHTREPDYFHPGTREKSTVSSRFSAGPALFGRKLLTRHLFILPLFPPGSTSWPTFQGTTARTTISCFAFYSLLSVGWNMDLSALS